MISISQGGGKMRDSDFSIKTRDQLIAELKELRQRVAALEEPDARYRGAMALLREQTHRAQLFFDFAGVIFVLLNAQGRVVLANRKACEVLGYERREVVGKDWFESFLPEGIREEVRTIFQKLVSGQARGLDYHENPVLTRTGQERLIAWHNTFLTDENGQVVGSLSSGEDITERKALEDERLALQAQLLQSQRMEAVGRLAGGIAHDFNNLLTIITGYTELLATGLEQDPKMMEKADVILQAAFKAAGLTRQLLAFSRRQVLQPKALDLNAVTRDMDKMLRRLIGEDIRVETQLDSELELVKADPGQIQQVLLNLVVNARDAMPKGGRLLISTANVQIDTGSDRLHRLHELPSPPSDLAPGAAPGTVRTGLHCAAPGDAKGMPWTHRAAPRDAGGMECTPGTTPGDAWYVTLSVSDTGDGISPDNLPHIFEPFFTTKEFGTGLGLSVVYGIVKQHEGSVEVSSTPGEGSTFTVFLPAFWAEQVEKETLAPQALNFKGHDEHVLLVEDDHGVRDFVSRALAQNGYRVTRAESAEDALEVFSRENGNFDLLFSDVVLPGRTGLDLAEEILGKVPDMPILLTSGYADQRSRWTEIRSRELAFLVKPYSLTELLQAVHGALHKQ